jgi:hypothetical protein
VRGCFSLVLHCGCDLIHISSGVGDSGALEVHCSFSIPIHTVDLVASILLTKLYFIINPLVEVSAVKLAVCVRSVSCFDWSFFRGVGEGFFVVGVVVLKVVVFGVTFLVEFY